MTLLPYFVLFITILEVNNAMISVPLYKLKSRYFHELEITLDKNAVSVMSIFNNEYYFNLSIGNPLQTFKIKLDTHSKNLWVISKNLKSCEHDEEVANLHSMYDVSKSNTSFPIKKKRRLPDLSRGFLCIDDISIGGFKTNRQVFLGVNKITTHKLINMASDGVLGLAYSNFTFKNYTSLFYNMIDQGIISRPIISLYLNRDFKSQILFGGLRPMMGNWSYIPIKRKIWEISLDFIQINNKRNNTFCDANDCRALVDTETYFIKGPYFETLVINNYIGAVPFLIKEMFAINCKFLSTLPSVSFILGGFNFTLTPNDYTRKVQYYGQSICISIFQRNEVMYKKYDDTLDNYWILGAAFMEIYHTALDFENKRIGFIKGIE